MQGITRIAASPQFTLQQVLDRRYEVLETIGRRQWERTYLAVDTHSAHRQRCVVKEFCLHHNSPQTLQAVKARFEYEKNWMTALGDYSQVAHLLNFIVTEQAVYLVREFVLGAPLISNDTVGDRWNEAQVEQLLIELLLMLQFVHSKAGIHGNIHPGNIIRRDSDKQFVLTDVSAISPMGLLLAEVQIADVMPGKLDRLGYFAKEQLWQRSRPNSDLFSLGMVCIHLLTGQCPWNLPRDSTTGQLQWNAHTLSNQRLSDALNAMSRDHYRDRPQSAHDVLTLLDATSATQRFITKIRRKRQQKAALQTSDPEKATAPETSDPSVPVPAPLAQSSPVRSSKASIYETGGLAIAASVVLIAGGSLALSRPDTLLILDSAPKTLQRAERQYQQGDLEAAIATVRTISPNNALFSTAQSSVQRWQQEWEQAARLFSEMETAFEAQQWLAVLRKGHDIPPTEFWNAQKAPFLYQAQKQVDQEGHAWLQDAFNLAYQHQFVEALDALRRIPPESAAFVQVAEKFAEYEQKRDIRAQYYLQQAYNDAQVGNFSQAIAFLQRITPETPGYGLAQQKQLEYAEKLRIRFQAETPTLDPTPTNPASLLREISPS